MLIADGDTGAVMSALRCLGTVQMQVPHAPDNQGQAEVCEDGGDLQGGFLANTRGSARAGLDAFMMENDGSVWDAA